MTEMISKWFFSSFRTPFSVLFYDAQEPRETGVFKHPPPQQVVENPKAHQGAC